MDTTILYLDSPGLDKYLYYTCLNYLEKAAEGRFPMVYMHQDEHEPISGLSMYKNMLRGLRVVHTKYVAIAEHDCIYSAEHFLFTPPDEEFFWYNDNCWLLQYKNPRFPEMDGMYSYIAKRRVQSQLICSTKKLIEAVELAMVICEDPGWKAVRGNRGLGEPGAVDEAKVMKLTEGSSKRDLRERIKDYLVGFKARDFSTKIPNIDIRHGSNFTGPRRGSKRYKTLEPWGTMEDLMVKL